MFFQQVFHLIIVWYSQSYMRVIEKLKDETFETETQYVTWKYSDFRQI